MVRHQAASKNGCPVLRCRFPSPLKIIIPIIFILEYILAVVSPLDGVMENIGYNLRWVFLGMDETWQV